MDSYFILLSEHFIPLLFVFIAAYLQSVTGFGLVIVGAPLLMFFYAPKLTIPIMLLLASCGNITQTLLLHREIKFSVILFLLVGAIIGQPIGLQIFANVPSHYLKIGISSVVLLSLIIMQIRQKKFQERPRNTVITGIMAGIMATTTGMAGPPIAMYFAHTKMPIRTLRATSIGFFCLSNIVSLATFYIGGIDLKPAFNEFIYLLPGLAVGILLGQLTFRFIPVNIFKKLIFALLVFTCIYTMYSSLC